MWWMGVTAALAGTMQVQDLEDVAYLTKDFRGDEALPWLEQTLRSDPDDPQVLIAWLTALARAPDAVDRPVLAAQMARWADQHPEVPARGAVHAMALALGSLGAWQSSGLSGKEGPWCGDALAALSEVPTDPEARWVVTWATLQLADTCGWDKQPLSDAQEALALSGEVGPRRMLWYRMDEADAVGLVDEVWNTQPVKLGNFAWMLRSSEGRAPTDEAVRARFLQAADDLMALDRPAAVASAVAIWSSALDADKEAAGRARWAALDPDHRGNRRAMQRAAAPKGDPEAPKPVEASTLVDPAQRLAALKAEGPPKGNTWDMHDHQILLVDTLLALDRGPEAVDVAVRGMKRRTFSSVRAVDLAVAHERHLGVALRAATALVRHAETPELRTGGVASLQEADEMRMELARALRRRAAVLEAMGRTGPAMEDWATSLVWDADDATTRLKLGMGLAATEPKSARDLLATGLALSDVGQDALRDDAEAALLAALTATGTWSPEGVHGYVQATRAVLGDRPEPEGVLADLGPFQDISFEVDGEVRRLSEVEGPVVVDLWATWCGPCREALPHVDQLARRWEGEVTFLVISVDRDAQEAAAYLAERGAAAFTAGWGGPELQTALGVSGIPQAFVLNGAHTLVAKQAGYGPGNTRLEEAIERMLAQEP